MVTQASQTTTANKVSLKDCSVNGREIYSINTSEAMDKTSKKNENYATTRRDYSWVGKQAHGHLLRQIFSS